MKAKILNGLCILTSLGGYLEWGGDQRTFLIQAEADILLRLFSDASAVIHPFTFLPLAGQLLLLFTLFQKHPNRAFTYLGVCAIAILLAFMFVIGLVSSHFKTALSTVPFLSIATLTLWYNRKKRFANDPR